MRFLVLATPRVPAPPDQLPGMIDRAEAWQERHSDRFEAFGLFPGGGGFGLVTVSDEAELHRMMAEMPFIPFSEVRIWPVVDGATGWQQVREAIAAAMSAA